MKLYSDLVKGLNNNQKKIVISPPGNFLILAGAGSGKTKILVHRIAWIIQYYQIKLSSIMAVTFTNKAANEMNSRIKHLLGKSSLNFFNGTFHSLCHKLLRIHYKEANLSQNFQIIDSNDQIKIINKIIKKMNLNQKN